MASKSLGNAKYVNYSKYGYMFIAPFFICYFLFALVPIVQVFIMAMGTNLSENILINGQEFEGFDNFDRILFADVRPWKATKEAFFAAIKNTCVLWIGNFVPQILLSLLLAVWFTDSKIKIAGKGVFKTIVYMPNIITAASVGALFISMFSKDRFCAANQILAELGMNTVDFLSSEGGFLNTGNAVKMVWFIQCWMWFGNTTLMLMSGIMGISESLFEAADIDGANSKQVFFRITLPLLKPMMLYTLVTSMIGGLQMYDIPVLYNNSPEAIPVSSLETITYLISKNYKNYKYGISGAISVLLFIITAILGSVIFFMYRDKDEIRKKKQLKKLRAQAKARAKGLGDFGI